MCQDGYNFLSMTHYVAWHYSNWVQKWNYNHRLYLFSSEVVFRPHWNWHTSHTVVTSCLIYLCTCVVSLHLLFCIVFLCYLLVFRLVLFPMCFSVSLFIHCFMFYFVVCASVYSCLVCFPALVIVFTCSLYSEKILPDSGSFRVSSYVILFPVLFSVTCFVSLLVWSIFLNLSVTCTSLFD